MIINHLKKVVRKNKSKKAIEVEPSKIKEVSKNLKRVFTENWLYKFLDKSYFGFHIAFIFFMFSIWLQFFNSRWLQSDWNITPNQMFPINLAIFLGTIFQIYNSINLLLLEKDVINHKKELSKEGFLRYIDYEYKKYDSKKNIFFTYIFNALISIVGLYTALYSANIIKTDYISIFLNFKIEDKVNWIMTVILVAWIIYFINSVNSSIRLKYLKKMYYSEFRKN